jgi:hypothetical protein
MKAIRLIAVFIAMTLVSSALACGNAAVSSSDIDKQKQAQNYQLPPAPVQTASAQTGSAVR